MSIETLLLIFVLIVTVAVAVQSIFMIQMARAATRLADRLDLQARELETQTEELMVRLRRLVDGLEPLTRMSETVSQSVEHITQMVQRRARDLDRLVDEMVQMGRDQVSKVDFVVTDTVQKFEQATEAIQKDVLQPAVEVSSFFKGIKAGLSYFLNRRSSPGPPETHPEEELFI